MRTVGAGLAALALVTGCSEHGSPVEPLETMEVAEASELVTSNGLEITNLESQTQSRYVVEDGGTAAGATRYTDRSYRFESPIPSALEGLTYIRTPNKDKDAQPGSSNFLSFDVDQEVTVYVAHDDRAELPTWLASGFTDTGTDLYDSDPYSGAFSVYSATFGAGTVTLGSNTTSGNGGTSMYTVLVEGQGGSSSDTEAPTAPAELSATASSSSQIDLSWKASSDNVGVSGYYVYRDGSRVAKVSGTSYSDTGLEASTSYGYAVAAYDAAGNLSPKSSSVSVTTKSGSTGPLSVTGLAVESSSRYVVVEDGLDPGDARFTDRSYTFKSPVPAELEGRLFIRTANDDKDDNPGDATYLTFDVNQDVTVYLVHDNRATVPSWVRDSFSDTGMDLQDSDPYSKGLSVYKASFPAGRVTLGSNLDADETGVSMYTVIVEGEGGSSGTDAEAPSVPTGLGATAVSSSRIDLSWTASSDNVGVTGYYVYRDGSRVASVSGTSYSDTGLQSSTSYSYAVAAYDAAGNVSGRSGSATARTGSGTVANVPVWGRHEVKLSASTSGNPFEVVVDGVFTHSSGQTIRMPGYYDGSGTWKIAFMPTRTGEWSYRTESPVSALNGVKGTIDAVSSSRKGLLERDPSSPRKWHFRGGSGVVPIALRMEFFSEPATLSEFEAAADVLARNNVQLMETRLTEEYGMFGGRHDFIFEGSWTNHRFDLDIWNRMEARMDALAARGLGGHIMFYSDDAGAPGWSGRSETEALVIRYVVARLAAYPSVVWNTGIDIAEYRSDADVDWMGAKLDELDPYDHPRSSRTGGGSGSIVMNAESFRSWGGPNTADYSEMLAARNAVSLPSSFDDAFGENRGDHPAKDHTAADIRRAGWKSLMVGGAGMLIRGGGDGLPQSGIYSIHRVGSDWESEQWLRRINPFIDRYLGSVYGGMEPTNGLVSGTGMFALADGSRQRILYFSVGVNDSYDSGGSTLTLVLDRESGSWSGTWFDPRTGATSSAGSFSGGRRHTVSAPSSDDWVLLLKRTG